MVPERHVPRIEGPEAEWGQGRGSWEEGGQGVWLPISRGLGDPRGRGADDWGEGCLVPQSPPPFFPFSLPKLPGSPRLPGQPLLPGAVTKETPCPPLPPSPSLACPPTPSSGGVEGGRGNGGGRTRTPAPERGAQTYTQRATSPPPPPRKPTSSALQLDTQRSPDAHSAPPPRP